VIAEAAVVAEGVSFVYGEGTARRVVANEDVSLTLPRGKVLGLLGANGAGKTTFVLQVLGLLKPCRGRLLVEGIDVSSTPEKVQRLTGFLPQAGMPMRGATVEQALFMTGRLRGLDRNTARKQAQTIMQMLELEELRHRRVSELSGGILRITNLGMALMGDLRLVVLDEPTNELDAYRRQLVWRGIGQMRSELGVTVLLVTHNLLEAEQVVDQVCVMQNGRVLRVGDVSALRAEYRDWAWVVLRTRSGVSAEERAFLERGGELTVGGDGAYKIRVDWGHVGEFLGGIVARFDGDRLVELHVSPPSLEDVYLVLTTGGKGQP